MRADIARSRGELGETIQALDERLSETREHVVDRVSPKRVWHRKTDELRHRLNTMAGSVTKTTKRMEEQVATSRTRMRGEIQELAEDGRERQAGLRQRAEDNPMAAGLVALGAGVLVASLLPPTPSERRAAQRLRSELGGPLQQRAGEIGRELAEDVNHSASARLEQVKSRAGDAVEQVKQESASSSEEVKGQTRAATNRVKGETQASTRRVKKTSTSARPAAGSAPSTAKAPPRRRPVRAR